MSSGHWFLFIVRCSDGSLYTAGTDDVERSVHEINAGGGSPYTRSRLPVFLAHTEEYMNEKDALRQAENIKKLSRSAKESLLAAQLLGAAGIS
jgi:putative endonuclease